MTIKAIPDLDANAMLKSEIVAANLKNKAKLTGLQLIEAAKIRKAKRIEQALQIAKQIKQKALEIKQKQILEEMRKKGASGTAILEAQLKVVDPFNR